MASVAVANHLLVSSPVLEAVSQDTRNSGFRLKARFSHYINPVVLVLDLAEVQSAAPIDLLRGLFQAAAALEQKGRRFERIVLSRSGTEVFHIGGEDFSELGAEYAAGQNPIYLVRTLPEKLLLPDGTSAYSSWSGGLLGVVGKQMEDVSAAANRWASGQ
ncbi:MAG: hypothetical protein KF709_04880 [Gemmatimonadaceae bacterium]|nr:hypothetical protein [Gemmatimonadaceae bacterium]